MYFVAIQYIVQCSLTDCVWEYFPSKCIKCSPSHLFSHHQRRVCALLSGTSTLLKYWRSCCSSWWNSQNCPHFSCALSSRPSHTTPSSLDSSSMSYRGSLPNRLDYIRSGIIHFNNAKNKEWLVSDHNEYLAQVSIVFYSYSCVGVETEEGVGGVHQVLPACSSPELHCPAAASTSTALRCLCCRPRPPRSPHFTRLHPHRKPGTVLDCKGCQWLIEAQHKGLPRLTDSQKKVCTSVQLANIYLRVAFHTCM